MTKFIPREKMSKKARRELDRAQRGMWEFSPVSRKVESRKVYNRKRSRVRDMDGTGSFLLPRSNPDGGGVVVRFCEGPFF